jgi:ketosteroid isomerase-like protein
MSQEPAAMSSRRDVLDQLAVRVPQLTAALAAVAVRSRPDSGTKRRLLQLQLERLYAAMARNDLDLLLLIYHPHAEVWMSSMASVGIHDCYRGHDGIRALFADVNEAFVNWRWTPRGVVDGGDRLAIRVDFLGYGRASGAEIAVSDAGTAVRLSERGLVVWQEWFVEQGGWSQAVEAAGLAE